MFGAILFLVIVVTAVFIILALYGLRVMWNASRASTAVIKHTEVEANHREMARLLDAMLVQDQMAAYLTVAHRDRATELVDEYHS
jgi:hypothetical protein